MELSHESVLNTSTPRNLLCSVILSTRSGHYPASDEVGEELRILLGDSVHGVLTAFFRVGQADFLALHGRAPIAGDWTAKGVGGGTAKLDLNALFQFRRDGVLQPVGFDVGTRDVKAQDVDDEALGEPVAPDDGLRRASPRTVSSTSLLGMMVTSPSLAMRRSMPRMDGSEVPTPSSRGSLRM